MIGKPLNGRFIVPQGYFKNHNRGADLDDERDPSNAPDLREGGSQPLSRRVLPTRRRYDPDSPWGLARFFSDSIRDNGLSILGLDLVETQRLAAYVSALLSEGALDAAQIRDMMRGYISAAKAKQVRSHVGYFWAMREDLARRVKLPPVICDPPACVWTETEAPAATVEWAW